MLFKNRNTVRWLLCCCRRRYTLLICCIRRMCAGIMTCPRCTLHTPRQTQPFQALTCLAHAYLSSLLALAKCPACRVSLAKVGMEARSAAYLASCEVTFERHVGACALLLALCGCLCRQAYPSCGHVRRHHLRVGVLRGPIARPESRYSHPRCPGTQDVVGAARSTFECRGLACQRCVQPRSCRGGVWRFGHACPHVGCVQWSLDGRGCDRRLLHLDVSVHSRDRCAGTEPACVLGFGVSLSC